MIFCRMLVTKRFQFPLTFIIFLVNTMEGKGNQNCLLYQKVTNILICVLHMKELRRGLE